MNSFTSNLTAADMVARQMISERVADAAARSEVRQIRAARRAARHAARQQARRTPAAQTHELPLWAVRFTFPVR
jgi:hypothetical protein